MAVKSKYLAGLAARSQTELSNTEDALVEYVKANQKRDALYESTDQHLADKYGALKAGR